jgi:hypothetical protein
MNERILPVVLSAARTTRLNHALEHATLNVLSRLGVQARLGGYSEKDGFFILGSIDSQVLKTAVDQAYERLLHGEPWLAIHEKCGTNYVAAGAVAGFAAWLGMLGVGSGWRQKADRLPMVMLLVTISTILAQPLGPFLQKELTTDPRVDAIRVVSITRYDRGALVVHRIRTARI